MALLERVGVEVVAEGADVAAAKLRNFADAENKVSEAAIRERLAVSDAEQAIIRKIRAEQAHAKAISDVLKPTEEAVKGAGALAKASDLAGGAMSALRKAAELIPGVELGTIFAGIAAGVYGLYKAFGPATDATQKQTAAFEAQTIAAHDLAAAHRQLLASQIGAGVAGAQQAIARLGPGVTTEATDQIIRLSAQRDAAAAAQAEALQRRTRQLGGLVPVSDSEQRRIESLQSGKMKIIAQAEERDESGAFKLSFSDRSKLAAGAQAYQAEIDGIRRQATDAAGWRLTDVVQSTTKNLADLDKQLRAFGVGAGAGPDTSRPAGRGQAIATPRQFATGGGFYPNMPGEYTNQDARYAQADRADGNAQLAAAHASEAGYYAMMAGHAGPQSPTAKGFGDIMSQSLDQGKEAFSSFTLSAMDMSSTVVSAVGAISGAFGQMATNLIISGRAGAKGAMEAAGNTMAALSAQAFGFGFMLEGLAGALLLAGPGVKLLGINAEGFAAAGLGAMGVGAGLAVAAKALGAKPLGALPTGGGAKGAAPGGSDAGLYKPQADQRQAAHFTFVLDGAPFYDGMVEEDNRRRRSGSMASPRLGRAA